MKSMVGIKETSKTLIWLFALLIQLCAMGAISKDIKTIEQMKTLEQTAREQWENTTRQNISEPSQQQTEQDNVLSKTFLFTWFPWLETTTTKDMQEYRGIKIKQVETFRTGIGVGTWREITLFGKKMESASNEIPETSALCVSSASSLTTYFKTQL
ncbi:uncharacterized protein LOC129962224 [Argiope bruennichi]|uniref:uncharacterized protein LOC129962224 n=1 Tax=Argiope bruennichi TaxID=94029 RepID=UPI0024951026|nr:uncharacterized protein LOC129962224 [Argiope bruennichi]